MQTLVDTLVRLSRRWIRSGSNVPSQLANINRRELSPGDRWGQFRIIAKLGSGSFGSVYHAQDMFERDVALKLLDSPEAIWEGKILSHLKHPNIVGVLSYEQSAQGVALSMEFIFGQSLEQFVAAHGKLDPVYATVIGVSLCRALAMVHRKALLHRDIKASNVMRQPDGRIVLIDFGLGQKMPGEDPVAEIAGTLPYMAPELFAGNAGSVATDIYAAGVLLFYLVSRQYPISGDSYTSFQEAHRSKARQHLVDIRPELPPEFVEVIETAIHPNPTMRFRTAGALAAALEDVFRVRPKRRPWVLLAGLAVLIAGGIMLVTQFRPKSGEVRNDTYIKMTKGEGLSQDPTLSDDGTLLAYASDEAESGNLDLWVRQVPDGAAIRLTNHPAIDWMPAFSPDGHIIAFRSERDGGGVYTIPALGGKEQLIAPGGYAPRISPDGKYIAYYTGELWHPRTPSAKLYVVPLEGGASQQICPQMADARNPVWVPDSLHLLFQGSLDHNIPPDNDAEWWIADLGCSAPENTGALKMFGKQGLEVHTWSAFWKNDYVIFSAAKKENINLWRAPVSLQPPYKLGEAQRLTSGAGVEASPWAASNGALVFFNQEGKLRIGSFPLSQVATHAGNKIDRVTATTDLDAFPSISRDEKYMAFTRTESETGLRQVWVKDLRTGEETRLTYESQQDQNKENPVISPDGETVAYSIIQKRGREDIYVLNRNSRVSRLLCSGCGIVTGWSSDGGSVLISMNNKIETLDIATAKHRPLLVQPGFYLDEAEWSPDGRWIAFSALSDNGDRHIYLASSDTSGKWTQVLTSGKWSEKPHWAADGRTLYFYSNEDGFLCLWKRSFDKASGLPVGAARPVHHFHDVRESPIHVSQPVRGFAVTIHRIYCNLPEVSGSIWMTASKK